MSTRPLALVGPAYPFRGGIAHFLESMYHGLRARGRTVSVVNFTTQYPSLLFPGKTQFVEGAAARPIETKRLLSSINPLTWRRTTNALLKLNPEAVLFQFWLPFFGPAYGWIARRIRKRGIRVLAVVHNAVPHEKRPGDRALARYFLSACDGLLTMSESVREDVRTLGIEAPAQLVKHPVYDIFGSAMSREDARGAIDLAGEGPVVLFFGYVRHYKGLHVLLEAMVSVHARRPDVRLVVAGEFYEDREMADSLIRDNGLEGVVRIDDAYVPNEKVAAYFCASDLVVQPYVSATQSGVAQIAFHFERPTIVTNVGGLAEIVPHEVAGLVIPPEQPDQLADSIIRFFDEEMADRLEEGVREQKKKYGWDQLFAGIDALLA